MKPPSWNTLKPLTQAFKQTLKPTFNIINNIVPILATVIFWTYLDRFVQVLAALLLFTMILQKMGFNTNIAERIQKTWVGSVMATIVRITTPAARIDDKALEENATIIADNTKLLIQHTRKLKEEIKMSKLKQIRAAFLLFMTSNKRMITLYLVILLVALDLYFGWSKTYNLPPDFWYYAAPIIVMIVMWLSGGEGWTGNIINKARQEAKLLKKEARQEMMKWQKRLDEVDREIKFVEDTRIDGVMPPHLRTRYDELIQSKKMIRSKVDQLQARINGEEVV